MAAATVNDQIGNSLRYNRLMGNSYTGSLYVGLCSLLESEDDLAGHRTRMVVDGEAIDYTFDAAGRLQSDGDAT